ncbi:MAG: tetratricopeptide repeat protein, partial [Magnetococcales bacterium]|nr:tetratricopeptide repeat protein [Magnetococcales bacterium]
KVLAIKPDHAEAHNAVGIVLKEQGRYDAALSYLKKAVSINPGFADAYSNLGNTLKAQGRVAESIANHEKAVSIQPNNSKAIKNLSLSQLLSGDFKAGWENFNCRWQSDQSSYKRFKKYRMPLWQGGPLAGKRILLWDEQGVGESILFASMIPELIKLVADITLECDKRLIPIFLRSFPAITCISTDDLEAANGGFDYHIPLGNLGRWLRADFNSFPKKKFHLIVDQGKRLELYKRYKRPGKVMLVGISWYSKSITYGQKSIKLQELLPLLSTPGMVFVDLQYGDTSKERRELFESTGIEIIHDEAINQMRDLDSFAAQVAAMDMVVSISNTTAHMAGSLGVPTLLMLGRVPLWYWMMDCQDSPWYSSLHLFRQKKPGEWEEVVEQVVKAVNNRIAKL